MANFADIIAALVAKLAEVYSDENAIVVTCRDSPPPLVGDKDLLVRIRGARKTEGVTAAAGRSSMQIRRFVDLVIRARQYSDVSQHDLRWLIDESNGILAMEASLLNLLEMWYPQLGIGGDTPQFLLLEPASISTSDEPLRDMRRTKDGQDPNCGMLGLRLDTYYEQDLKVVADLQ